MAATLLPVQPAAAGAPSNVVLNWNATAAAALFNAPTAVPPGAGQATPVAAIHMAMVQGAVFDAVNSIEGGYEPYLDVPSAPPGASVDAAVATAAKRVLKKVIPLVAPLTDPAVRDAILAGIQTQFETELAAIPAGSAKRQGRQAGRAAATAMLEDRMGDGQYPSTPFMFTEGTGVGEWRPTNGVSDPFAWVANVRPFTLKSTSQFRTDGPHAVTSDAYAEEYAEVQALGAATDSTRTPEQTALATFYLPSPIEMFNRTFRTISVSTSLDVAESGAALRDAQPGRRRRADQLLGRQGVLALLAPGDRDQPRCQRREPRYGERRGMGALHLDDSRPGGRDVPGYTAVSRPPVGLQLRDEFHDARGEAVLRQQQDDLHRRAHAGRNGADLHAVHRRRARHDRRSDLSGHPLPSAGRPRSDARQERGELGGVALPQTLVLIEAVPLNDRHAACPAAWRSSGEGCATTLLA